LKELELVGLPRKKGRSDVDSHPPEVFDVQVAPVKSFKLTLSLREAFESALDVLNESPHLAPHEEILRPPTILDLLKGVAFPLDEPSEEDVVHVFIRPG
jgi:hypothetical protein